MRSILFPLALLIGATAVQAETIRVAGFYPATSSNAAALRSIMVEPFGGDAGDDLTIQVEDTLRSIDLGRGPWFQVIPATTGSGGEALLRGTAETEQRFSEYTEEHERCIKDADGKCTAAKEKVTVKCRKRQVELVVQLRLIGRDGALLWSDNRPELYEESRCEDSEGTPRARGAIARELNAKVARRLRFDFAPRRVTDDVRVDENRKGLNKDDAAAFKEAVRWTKEDAEVACQVWGGIADRNPRHVPTLYNLGLCAESGAGTGPELAREQYRAALAIDPKHKAAQRGLDRLAAYDRAAEQLRAHAGQ